MTHIGLLYQSEQHARTLIATLDRLGTDYEADILSLSDLWRVSEYDLLQTDELLRYGASAVLAGQVTDTPVVSHLQGWGDMQNSHEQYGHMKYAAIRALGGIARRGVAGVLYVSKATEQHFPYSFDRYGYAGPFVAAEMLETAQSNVREEPQTVLTVTNLRYREKLNGVRTILDGLRPLFATRDDLRYRIAGGGEYLDTLRETVTAYPYADRVDVLGYRDDIPSLLGAADLFVYVSYLDAHPRVLLEAQAVGVPVIGGDYGGVPEAVSDTGIVCPPTAAGVSGAVRTLIRNDDLRASFAAAGRERMTAHNRKQAYRHIALWDEILYD